MSKISVLNEFERTRLRERFLFWLRHSPNGVFTLTVSLMGLSLFFSLTTFLTKSPITLFIGLGLVFGSLIGLKIPSGDKHVSPYKVYRDIATEFGIPEKLAGNLYYLFRNHDTPITWFESHLRYKSVLIKYIADNYSFTSYLTRLVPLLNDATPSDFSRYAQKYYRERAYAEELALWRAQGSCGPKPEMHTPPEKPRIQTVDADFVATLDSSVVPYGTLLVALGVSGFAVKMMDAQTARQALYDMVVEGKPAASFLTDNTFQIDSELIEAVIG